MNCCICCTGNRVDWYNLVNDLQPFNSNKNSQLKQITWCWNLPKPSAIFWCFIRSIFGKAVLNLDMLQVAYACFKVIKSIYT